jgi:hypothetical protein
MPSGTTSTNASAQLHGIRSAVHSMLATGRRNAYDDPRSPAQPADQSVLGDDRPVGTELPIELLDRALVGERS